jgi:hypothetical protein
MHPEMVALGAGIGNPGVTNARDFLQHGAILQRGPAQVGPVSPLAASDYVIDGGQGELLMV